MRTENYAVLFVFINTTHLRFRMKAIHIDEVLVLMEAHYGATFQLAFVRATGKRAGSICHINRAKKGVGSRVIKTRTHKQSDSNGRKKPLHKDNETIPIVDTQNEKYMSVLISHIIKFNNRQVTHT